MTGIALPMLRFTGHQKILLNVTMYGGILLIVLGSFMSHYYGIMDQIIPT